MNERLVRVFDRDGHQQAERTFSIANAEVITHPSVDLSPSGHAVSYDSGLATESKKRWIWASNEVAEFKLYTYTTRLRDDDNAWGIVVNGSGGYASSDINIVSAKINESQQEEFQGHNFNYGQATFLTGVQSSNTLDGITLISGQGINVLVAPPAPPDDHNGQVARYYAIANSVSTRFHSLWPQNDEARFLAFDDRSRTLALATDHDILLFVRWLPNSTIGSKADFLTSHWSLAVANDQAIVASCRDTDCRD